MRQALGKLERTLEPSRNFQPIVHSRTTDGLKQFETCQAFEPNALVIRPIRCPQLVERSKAARGAYFRWIAKVIDHFIASWAPAAATWSVGQEQLRWFAEQLEPIRSGMS